MNKLLLLFIILLLGLVLCSFLGGNCYTEGFTTEISNITGVKSGKGATSVTSDETSTTPNTDENVTSSSTPSTTYDNYNHYNQSSYPTKYYGPNGTTATVINTNGTYTLAVTETNGTTTIYNVDKSSSSVDTSSILKTTFYGQNGGTAKVITDTNGSYLIKVTQPDGTTSVYTVTNTQSTVVPPPQQPTTQSSTYSSGQNYSYYNGPNVNAGTVTTPSGTTYAFATETQGNLPVGIPKSMIPPTRFVYIKIPSCSASLPAVQRAAIVQIHLL